MNRKYLSVLVVFLLLAVTTISVYALITIDGDVTTDINETEWASATCTNDLGGANDNGGGARLDLTRVCVYEGAYYNVPGNIYFYWNFDNSSFTVATEACALFGTATNGVPDDANADFALCGTVDGSPLPSLVSATLYSCDNSSATSCGAPVVINAAPNCAAARNGNDPFQVGNDTTVECRIPIADIGASQVTQNRAFLDVCVPTGQDCLTAPDVPLAIHLTNAGVSDGNGAILLALVFALAFISLFVVRRHRAI